MPKVKLQAMSMKGVVACVPEHEVSNEKDYPWFEPSEIRKVTAMVGKIPQSCNRQDLRI